MTDQYKEATEEHFRLRGWKEDSVGLWTAPIEGLVHRVYGFDLPPICESIKDWKKWIAEFMGREHCKMFMNKEYVEWHKFHDPINAPTAHFQVSYQKIKDHEILLASVLACNEYLREKKNG